MLYAILSLACAALSAAVYRLWHFKLEDDRRRALTGDVVRNYEFWLAAPDVTRELRASCDLAMAEVVKGSIRARTPEAMAYREGAFDALSVLKKHLAVADPAKSRAGGTVTSAK